MKELNLPSELHRRVIESISDFFLPQDPVDTILLTNSCARGKAIPESDVDFAVLVKQDTPPGEIKELEERWHEFLHSSPILNAFKNSHGFAQIHLDIIDGRYVPSVWDDGGGPDSFEVEIGNHLVYSAPLNVQGNYFAQLCKTWLPYYAPELQQARLQMVKNSCIYDLDQVQFLVKRQLYFHAFDKLYKAFREFLQALFMNNKKYPIAYNKWIKEQFYEVLALPRIYDELAEILSVNNIESNELVDKAKIVKRLLERYC